MVNASTRTMVEVVRRLFNDVGLLYKRLLMLGGSFMIKSVGIVFLSNGAQS